MNSMLKLSSLLLLSMGAFAAHAASQSVTVNYTLTIPTVCTLSGNGTSINKTLPHEGTAVNQSIDVKCNVPYSIKARSANSKGVNQSAVISTANPTLNIPYNITTCRRNSNYYFIYSIFFNNFFYFICACQNSIS